MDTTAPATLAPARDRALWLLGIATAMLFVDQVTKKALYAGASRSLVAFQVAGADLEVGTSHAFNRWFLLGVGEGWLAPDVVRLLVTLFAGIYWVSLIEALLKPSIGWMRGIIYALAAGGVIGNLLDRWMLGGVRDVIAVTASRSVGVSLFVNLADVAIIAAIMYGNPTSEPPDGQPSLAPPTSVPEAP
jgi:lipoprotein signal peptidase